MSFQDTSVICPHGTSSRVDELTAALVHYNGDICDEPVNTNPAPEATEVWNPQADRDGVLTLGSAVGQAIGSASMCWKEVEKAGEFDSLAAGRVYDGLMSFLADWADGRLKVNTAEQWSKFRAMDRLDTLDSFSTRELLLALEARTHSWPTKHVAEKEAVRQDANLYLAQLSRAILDDRE